MSYASNLDFPILIISVSNSEIQIENPFQEIMKVLALNNYHFIHADTHEAALMMTRKESGIGCIIINEYDDAGQSHGSPFIQNIIRVVRAKNSHVPIFFSSRFPLLGRLPTEVVKEIHEYININEDTPKFIAGRIHLAIRQYIDNLLPPYFAALKNYALDSPYYWDCPGHQGGSPVVTQIY